MMLIGAIVNALQYSRSNFLFSGLNKGAINEEHKTHNLAIELQQSRDEWSEKRVSRFDFNNEEVHRQGHGMQTFKSIDAAMQEYALFTGKSLSLL